MGGTVDDMLSLSRSYLDDFSPADDLSVDFHSVSTQTMTVMLHHAVKIARIADAAFQEIDHTVLDSLEFLEGQHTLSCPVDTCLIAWTAEDQFFKLRLRDLVDFSVELECIKLPSVTSVPELSTGFLVGVGLVVILGILGRKTRRSRALGAFVILCFGGASMVSAQSSSITVVKVASTWGKQYAEPLIIMSTSEEAATSIRRYRQRFGIEPMFKDHKSNGFDLERTKVTDPKRLETLLIVMALAHIFCTSEGYRREESGDAKKNVSRDNSFDQLDYS